MNQPPLAQLMVKSPSLTLYAFHLRHSLTEGSEQVRENAAQLWEQCVKLGEHLNIDPLKSLKSKIEEKALESQYPDKHSHLPLELLGNQRTLEFSQHNGVSGEIYPVRIHDTYAVDLTLRYEKPVDIDQLSHLNPNGYLLSSWMRPSLGETLVLFAEPLASSHDYQSLADACIKAVLSTSTQPQPSCISRGKLFGSPIFEYDNLQEDPIQRCHFWVWLKITDDTLSTRPFNFKIINNSNTDTWCMVMRQSLVQIFR